MCDLVKEMPVHTSTGVSQYSLNLVTWHHRNHLKCNISGTNELAVEQDASDMDVPAKNLQVLIWTGLSLMVHMEHDIRHIVFSFIGHKVNSTVQQYTFM